jgi:hypothetical protein
MIVNKHKRYKKIKLGNRTEREENKRKRKEKKKYNIWRRKNIIKINITL